MSGRRILPALLATLAFACAFVSAQPASAEEASAAPAPPLARLNAEEQRIVRAKIPDFDALPLEKQEQVVRNVEWLRTADPALRDMIKRRVQQAHEARLGGQRLEQRVRDFDDLGARQGMAFHQGLVLGGLGRVAWRDLPEAIRTDPHARSVERPFAVAFHRKFWWRAFNALTPAVALAFEPSGSLPPELHKRLTTLRSQAQNPRTEPKVLEKTLAKLKEAVLQAKAYEATRDLLAPPPVAPGGSPGTVPPPVPPGGSPGTVPPPVPPGGSPGSASGAPRDPADGGRRLLALGERLRDLARPAYDETLADFTAKWRSMAPQAWAEAVAKLAQPPELPPEMRRKIEALQAAFALEALGGFLVRHPMLVSPADQVLKVALVDELGMPADEFARLPARGDGPAQEQRALALKQWLERSGLPAEVLRQGFQQQPRRWPGAGGWFPGRGKPGSNTPPRPPDGVRRPGEEKKSPPDDEKPRAPGK